MSDDVMTFDRLVPGTEMGRVSFDVTPEVIARWQAIYPELPVPEDGTAPPGLAAVIAITAYAAAVPRRPPGNVHGGQWFRWRRPARVGERLATTVRVAAKETKGERRWVTFETLTADAGGRPVLEGRMVSLWAR